MKSRNPLSHFRAYAGFLTGALCIALVAFPVATEAARRVATEQELLAAALAARPGDSLVLAHDLTSTADPTVLWLSALAGDTEVRIVGATDLVKTSPAMPGDLEIECLEPVPFTTAEDKAGSTLSPPLIHPIYSSTQFDRFPGPERELTLDPSKRLPVPFDYDADGNALGLRVRGNGRGWQHAKNHLRHTADHDGHIVWVAEYLLEDGTRKVTWEEVPMTRANSPTFRPRVTIIEGDNPATHLLKLVTLEVSSAADLMVKDKGDAPDPRRWSVAPKRMQSNYTPHLTMTADGDSLPLAKLQQAIIEVEIDENGGIVGLAPGEDYVIELPPVPVDVEEERNGAMSLIAFGSLGVDAHLMKLKQNRIFLIGTPGKTIIPALNAIGVANIDFGWITFGPLAYDERENTVLTVGKDTDIRFFGCVIDTVDYSSDGSINIFGGQNHRGPNGRGGWMEFYDGYIGDTEGPTFSYSNQNLNHHEMPRVIIARSIMDISNDGFSAYGQGMLLMESNYWYGGGGRYNEKSGNYQHRDIMGQFYVTGHGLLATAYYNNIFSMGNNLVGRTLALRGSGSMLMYQPSCDYASEYVGNIIENNGASRGMTGLHTVRAPVSLETGSSWGYGMHIAENIIFERPDTLSTGFTFPYGDTGNWRGGRGPSMDTWFATNNITPFINSDLEVSGFQRAVNWLPESAEGWQARWLTVSGHVRGMAGRFASGDVLRGASSGAQVTVYDQERSGADSKVLIRSVDGKFQSGEALMSGSNEVGKFGGVSEPFAYQGARASYPSAAEAFAHTPKVSGTYLRGYQLDWSGTTYGGTDREGFYSAQDFEVAQRLRRYSADGQSGGPGLPFHGDYLKRFMDLPVNFNTDLLGYDQPDSGYSDTWYGQWAPRPFKLAGTYNDPWTPMPGRDTVDEKDLLVNTRIATLGTGTLAEEFAPDGSFWRLEILADGTHRPRFTIKDSKGKTLYQVTSAYPAVAGEQLLFGVSTQHRSYGQEYPSSSMLWSRWVWDHFIRAKKTSDLFLTVAIQDKAPAVPGTLAEGETFVWVDTADSNMPKVFDGKNWDYLQGDLSEALATFLLGLAKDEGTFRTRFMGTNMLPVKTFRIYAGVYPQGFDPKAKPNEDDYAIFALPNQIEFNSSGAYVGRYKGGAWETNPRLPYVMANVPHGDVRCYFRIGGKESIREADWIWANLQQDLVSQTHGIVDPKANKKRGGNIRPLKVGATEIASGISLLEPTHATVYAMGSEIRNRQLLVLGEDYTIENLGMDQHGTGATIVLLKPYLQKVNDRIYIEPSIPESAVEAYGWDNPIPRGEVKLGSDAGDPFTGTVNYFEARRQRGYVNQHQSITVSATGVQHRFARAPVDPATGQRDTPLLPAADVWVTAETLR